MLSLPIAFSSALESLPQSFRAPCGSTRKSSSPAPFWLPVNGR
jgi:hypothetical protein